MPNSSLDHSLKVHWFIIKVYDQRGPSGTQLYFLKWDNLRWDLRLKYDWYFKYRAALLQVKYPRATVDCYWGNDSATGKTRQQLLRAKITNKKGRITSYKNKIERIRSNWDGLFEPEVLPMFNKLVDKLAEMEDELIEMQYEFESNSTTATK